MSGNYTINFEQVTDIKESNYVKPLRLHYKINGKNLSWDCILSHNSLSIILYNADRKKLIFVKQFRPALLIDKIKAGAVVDPASAFTLELCSGIVDKPGATLEEIARDEVLEEVGYNIPLSSLKFITSYRGSVGIAGYVHSLFFAKVRDHEKVTDGGGIDNENIEVVELDFDEAKKLIWCADEDTPNPRNATFLIALNWFFHEYLPHCATN